MINATPTDEPRCDYCGSSEIPIWLGVETRRDNGGAYKDLRVDVQDLGFCGEEHAGRYFLEGKLPAPDFSEPESLPRTWRDRLFDMALPLLLIPGLALMLLGSWTAAQWVLR